MKSNERRWRICKFKIVNFKILNTVTHCEVSTFICVGDFNKHVRRRNKWISEGELNPPVSQPFLSLFPPSHSPHTLCLTCGKTPHSQTCSSGPGLPAASFPTLYGHSSLFPLNPAHFKVPQCVFLPTVPHSLSLSFSHFSSVSVCFPLPCMEQCTPCYWPEWLGLMIRLTLVRLLCAPACLWLQMALRKWPTTVHKAHFGLEAPPPPPPPSVSLSLDRRLILSHRRALSGLPAAFRWFPSRLDLCVKISFTHK